MFLLNKLIENINQKWFRKYNYQIQSIIKVDAKVFVAASAIHRLLCVYDVSSLVTTNELKFFTTHIAVMIMYSCVECRRICCCCMWYIFKCLYESIVCVTINWVIALKYGRLSYFLMAQTVCECFSSFTVGFLCDEKPLDDSCAFNLIYICQTSMDRRSIGGVCQVA